MKIVCCLGYKGKQSCVQCCKCRPGREFVSNPSKYWARDGSHEAVHECKTTGIGMNGPGGSTGRDCHSFLHQWVCIDVWLHGVHPLLNNHQHHRIINSQHCTIINPQQCTIFNPLAWHNNKPPLWYNNKLPTWHSISQHCTVIHPQECKLLTPLTLPKIPCQYYKLTPGV